LPRRNILAKVRAASGVDAGVALEMMMSMHGVRVAAAKVTPQSLLAQKQAGAAITAVTAYDYPGGRMVDEAGVDVVLVGDSVGMAVLGYEDTLAVTMEDMLHHARAVRRGVGRALLVVDMPYGSYQVSVEDAVRNGLRLVKEAGAEAVKLEGGAAMAGRVRALTGADTRCRGGRKRRPQGFVRMLWRWKRLGRLPWFWRGFRGRLLGGSPGCCVCRRLG
jgi:3-methyl-2-oxobutanoate hydroxymethyltransferase